MTFADVGVPLCDTLSRTQDMEAASTAVGGDAIDAAATMNHLEFFVAPCPQPIPPS